MIIEILGSLSNLNEATLPAFDEIQKMRKQALTHNSRRISSEIFEEKRPNETPQQYEYRKKNIRRFTQELPDKFLTKISRLFTSGGFWISKASDYVMDYLESQDVFFVNGAPVDYREYIIQRIIPESIISPNSLFLFFPTTNGNLDLVPSENLPNNQLPVFVPTLVKYEQIAHLDRENLIFRSDEIITLSDNKKYHILFAADKDAFYKLIPKLVKSNDGRNVLQYEVTLWYAHNCNYLHINWLIGRSKINEDGNEIRESYLYTAYEHLDEAMLAISDDQAVRTKSAFPHIVMSEIECSDCNGTGLESDGQKCHSCKGSKVKAKGGILDAFLVPPGSLNQQETYLNPFIQFIAPDTGILEFIHKVAFDTFYKNSFRVVGLKSILDVSESGIAKSKRLEDLQDILRDISMNVKSFTEAMIFQLETYLKAGRDISSYEWPVVRTPESYAALDNETIGELMKEARGEQRRKLYKQAYLIENGESPKTIKVIESAMKYSPLLGLSTDEINLRISAGAYDATDILIMDNIIRIVEDISKEAGFILKDYSEIRIIIGQKIAEEMIIPPPLNEI